MKEYYNKYIYLPARDEHYGIGSIIFNNLLYAKESYSFVNNLIEL